MDHQALQVIGSYLLPLLVSKLPARQTDMLRQLSKMGVIEEEDCLAPIHGQFQTV
jgi:hypothetical protein